MTIPSRMKLLQIEAPGRAIWRDAPVPEPGPGEVLVRIRAIATCPHWDLHIFGGQPMFPGMKLEYPYLPGQPGHEAVGEVVVLGPGVTALQVGMSVAVWRDTGRRPQGCYAQFNVLRADDLLEVPATLAVAEIASLELAMCVEVSFQQLARLGGVAGRSLGLAGLGPAGLVAVQLARAHGHCRLLPVGGCGEPAAGAPAVSQSRDFLRLGVRGQRGAVGDHPAMGGHRAARHAGLHHASLPGGAGRGGLGPD